MGRNEVRVKTEMGQQKKAQVQSVREQRRPSEGETEWFLIAISYNSHFS